MIKDYWRGCRPSKAAQIREMLRSCAVLPSLAVFMRVTGIGVTPGEFGRCVRQVRAERGERPTSGRPVFLPSLQPLDVALELEDLADHIAFSVATTAPKRAPNLEELEELAAEGCETILEYLEQEGLA